MQPCSSEVSVGGQEADPNPSERIVRSQPRSRNEERPLLSYAHLAGFISRMAGSRRQHKRPPYQPPNVQPLPIAPGANRFQPSEAYLARVGQQSSNLTPATSPAFWPPTPSPAPIDQAAALAQPSAAARWVEEQERVHETTGFAPPPSGPPSASEEVEQVSDNVKDLAAAPPGELLPSLLFR